MERLIVTSKNYTLGALQDKVSILITVIGSLFPGGKIVLCCMDNMHDRLIPRCSENHRKYFSAWRTVMDDQSYRGVTAGPLL